MSGFGRDNKLSLEYIGADYYLNINKRLCIYMPSGFEFRYLYFYHYLNGRYDSHEIAKYNLRKWSLEYSDAEGEEALFIERICSFFHSIFCARYYIEHQAQQYDFVLSDNIKVSYCRGDTISFRVDDKSATYDFRWGEFTGDQETQEIIEPFCDFVAILLTKFSEDYLEDVLKKIEDRRVWKEAAETLRQENRPEQLAELIIRLGWRCQTLQNTIEGNKNEIRRLNRLIPDDDDDGWDWRREVD